MKSHDLPMGGRFAYNGRHPHEIRTTDRQR